MANGLISGAGTPVPMKEREAQDRKVNNEVKVTYLSPEEMEKEFARLGIKPKVQEQKPIPTHNELHESNQNEEMNDVVKTAGAITKPMPEKDEYLKLRIEGKSRTEIYESIFKVNPSVFYGWLDKWKIKSRLAEDLAIENYRLRQGLPVESINVTHDNFKLNTSSDEVESSTIDLDRKIKLDTSGEQKNDVQASQNATEGGEVKQESQQKITQSDNSDQVNKTEDAKTEHSVRFISIQIPVYNTKTSPVQQLKKVLSEVEELNAEMELTDGNRDRILHELFDVMESVINWCGVDISQLIIGDQDTKFMFLSELIKHHNGRHIEKVRSYAEERGWEVY